VSATSLGGSAAVAEPPPFDSNHYRKTVLAAVEKRGGPDTSDPFELYDLPLDDDLDDTAVAARVGEVWGFWQRQRDHPKYRVLAALLVDSHDERSAELLDAGRRRLAVARVRAQREQRDSRRYELLDAAISRLVARHGGVPRDKVAGLDEIGVLAGLSPDEVAARLRRHRTVDATAPTPAQAAEPAVAAERRRQIRALLDEFGRLTEVPAPPTLLVLLGLEPSASEAQVRASGSAWRARARELPPQRLRTVVDELLVHVGELLEPGHAAVEAYLDAVVEDVAAYLRPRVRAAVLVEDRLVAEDHAHLHEEAVARGLDERRATAVLAALAAELGTTIEGPAAAGPAPAPARGPDWEGPLKAARAALRAGHPVEASARVDEARRLAGDGGTTAVRAVADEIDAVLAAAELRWRAAVSARDARRWAEALDHAEHLARTASDLHDVREMLSLARAEVERADTAVAAAVAGPAADRTRALLAVLDRCPEHPGAVAALAAIPLAAPAWVSAARDARGDVVVLWAPSETPEVSYRVSRLRPDGSWQVLGRVQAGSMEDGGAPAGVEAPVYAVAALQAGRSSPATRSDTAPEPVERRAEVGLSAPKQVRATRLPGGSVEVTWVGPAGAEFRVRCADGDRWRVVGRTRATSMEDGGAPAGPVGVYAVSAAISSTRSAEGRSDGR
jgi:hypothetical protein